jgi:hypothetical protein
MYTLFSNEKLGKTVEAVRLREIRQQIEGQRLGEAVSQSWRKRIIHQLGGGLGRLKVLVGVPEWKVKRQNDLREAG